MNPRRLTALLAAVTAAVILVLRLAGDPVAPGAPPTTALTSVATPDTAAGDTVATPSPAGADAVATPATGPAPAVAGHLDDDAVIVEDPQDSAPVPAGAAETAAAFALAWTRHTGPAARAWFARVSTLCTPALAGKLRHVDPAVVPADTVTGAPKLTSTTADFAAARVPTNGGTLHLTLIHTGRWQINTLDWTS